MNNNDTRTNKEKIIDFVRENKFKSFMIVIFIIVILFVIFNKKENKKNAELKEITTLYKSKDNTDDLYKTKYFKQIDPQLQDNSKDIEKLKKQVEEMDKRNKELENKIVESAKSTYGDILNSKDTYAGENNLNDMFNKNYSTNQQPIIPPLKGTVPPTQGQKIQFVEWEVAGAEEQNLLLIDEENQVVKEDDKKQEEKFKMIIPSATLLLVKLDNGMHLSTLTMSKSASTPVTATVVSEAFMPNGRTFDVKGAKMVLEGIGSLSSERGYIKPLRMSGFNSENETFDLPIQGYVSDVRTGIQGIQGEIISKQESLFWSSLIAYTLQGLGKGVASSQQVMTTSAFGTTTNTPPDKILSSSLANGVGEGAKEVGNAILEIAKNIEPIVEILGNQYAIVHTTMPFILEYKIDGNDNYNTEIPVTKNENETTKKVDSLVKGMKK
ncbi:MAG: TraB/VirB10 family protein [Aliarcobacter sp.]|nr:TraB/VirB10 family protein [Aliarcobacter sp.]